MKIIDLLTKDQNDAIDKLLKSYVKGNEFEVGLFSSKETSNHLLTLEKFNNLNSILTIITEKNEIQYKKQTSQTLDISMSLKNSTESITNYRITISGINKINEYMSMLHMRKNHLVFGVLIGFYADNFEDKNEIQHITVMKKTKNVSTYVLLSDVYLKIKLDYEEDINKKELSKLMKINENYDINTYNISFRFKERFSYFITKGKNIFRIDLTMVKSATLINNIDSKPYHYEIEIECEIKDKATMLVQLFDICEFIIKSIQGSNYIISQSTSHIVLNKYKEILSVDSSKTNLHARQPISLEIQHVVDYLPNRYAVTDKADGDRYYMIVLNGRCYLISTNLIVKDTGIDIDNKFNNTIIDGEYIFIAKYNKYIYMAFDCIMSGDQHVKDESKFIRRLEYLDEIIYGINSTKYKHNFIGTTGNEINLSDMNAISKYHKKNLIKFYDDIDNELQTKSNKILFRRKYFFDSLGTSDNEIFKYSELIWNMFTTLKEIKCSYHLDGLIYHPLEQKYVVEIEKSKYFEYKWKPPHKNSIDFYIEFKKDNNKKIIIAYDNSVDSTIKNKRYVICNLFVGLNIKGIEKPVLFGTDQNIYEAYVYVDENDNARSIDGKQLVDRTVVEFYYNLQDDLMPPYRWIPMKTRFDKTESVQKYGKRYGNAQRTAYAVWRSIRNPVLMSDFKNLSDDKLYNKYFKELQNKKDLNLVNMEKTRNIYYQKKTDIIKDMGKFHGWIKSNLIYTYMNPLYDTNIQYKVLDIGCGRGGDIMKFYYVLVDTYVGIDPEREGLINDAIPRYNHAKKTHANFPPCYFINADAGALLQYDEQLKSIGKMNTDDKKIFEKFFSWDNERTMFDRVNCQFVIHYLFSNENAWNNYTENLNMYLREGGYFIFTTFDGDLVREKLKSSDNYAEYYNEGGDKKLLFDIQKKYNSESTSEFGNAIDVHMAWIFEDGVYVTEYLINPQFIIKSLKERCNMELVETVLFKDMFDDHKEFLNLSSVIEEDVKRKKFFVDVNKYYTPTEINTKCYEYTNLNRCYIFRKKETDLAEIKKKYFMSNRNKIVPGKLASKKH